ncbi:winged helix-turn-helix domain-containing protein [Citrobacter amalonaticus]|uniref:winged helix-turn-helix domain-containing protein n=1 Tax=Citrobacter amalonaticus TaxID=35703 RepID=UPI00287A2150|nr:winged helix-turn-helix domain-containing protein [Citrobacter amalonaticus]MDS4039439.1 winged helix-turn-helix domain-containing protein [Citrobacter amalonaticus]
MHKNGYLIGKEMEFWPSSFLLKNRRTNVTFFLTKPASRCLLLLIQAAPEIVKHSVFIRDVWADDNLSLNVLYQNISLIRKGFGVVSTSGENIIRTVSRKGFSLTTEVIRIEDEKNKLQSQTSNTEISVSKQEETVNIADFPSWYIFRKKILPLFHISGFLGCVVFSFILAHLVSTLFEDDKIPQKYRFLHKSGNCLIYISDDTFHINEKLMAAGEKIVDCESYPYVYTTSWRYLSSLRMIACHSSFTTDNSPRCITYVYRREK